MGGLKAKYDFISDFHQGVAVVVKNDLYGAILVGGHEIIPPSFDYIATFKDGLAQAIINGRCEIIDLSGRMCKKYNGQWISIPAKYDSVCDFNDGYACVMLDGKWGAIDTEGNEIFAPQFDYLSDFIKGTAIYQMQMESNDDDNDSWGYLNIDGYCSECNLSKPPIITDDGNLILSYDEGEVLINNIGQLLISDGISTICLPQEYVFARDFACGLAVVQDTAGFWGAIDINGRIVIPLQYTSIQKISEFRAFAVDKDNKLLLFSADGSIIKAFDTYTDAKDFNGGYAIVRNNEGWGVINTEGEELLAPQSGFIRQKHDSHVFEISEFLDKKIGIFDALLGIYIAPKFKRIIEVRKDCVLVEVDQFGETFVDFEGRAFIDIEKNQRTYLPDWCLGVKPLCQNVYLGVSDQGKWGLVDNEGNTLCMPTFDNVGELHHHLFTFEVKEKVERNYWSPSTEEVIKYGIYNIKKGCLLPEYYKVCPEYVNGFYRICKDNLFGAIDENGNIVLVPEWKQVDFVEGYFVISKMTPYGFSMKEFFGVADQHGNILFDTKYDEIVPLRKNLFKIREAYSWSVFTEKKQLLKERYDKIDVEGEFFIVSLNGHQFRLNKKGKKVILGDDGIYIELPSKIERGDDFKNGLAKVWINDCENYVDKSFNIVINNGSSTIAIDKCIDYLAAKDEFGHYVFVSKGKYGIINHLGEKILEAKYDVLTPLANNLFIAGREEMRNVGKVYGIIDLSDRIVLPFEYASIKSFDGKIPSFDGAYRYDSHSAHLSSELRYWAVQKEGYGLVDSKGSICLQPKYDFIGQTDVGFIVKSGGKYGFIASDYSIVCEPQYDTVEFIGKDFWLVSIKSETYNGTVERYGVLDFNGKECLEPIYQFIGNVNDESVAKGRAVIKLENRIGVVDENYRVIAAPQYTMISDFKNGKAKVTRDITEGGETDAQITYGVLDINGAFLSFSEFTETCLNGSQSNEDLEGLVKILKTLKNGCLLVQIEDQNPLYQFCAVLDKNNKIILPFKYHRVEELENGMYMVYLCMNYDGVYGLLDHEFKEVLAPHYEYLVQVQDAFALSVCGLGREDSVGLVDSNGNLLLDYNYSSIENAAPGLVWIYKNRKIGLASTKGKVLICPKYGKVEPFMNGFAKVDSGTWREVEEDSLCHCSNYVSEYSKGKWGLINSDGLEILHPVYDSIEFEGNELIKVSRHISVKSDPYGVGIEVTGVTNYKGDLLIKDCYGRYILASKKYDWQNDFNDEGYSQIYYHGSKGILNENFQQVVRCPNNGKSSELILPEEFDWVYDSDYGYFVVERYHKKGVIDSEKNLIVETFYDRIDLLYYDHMLLFKCGIQTDDSLSFAPRYTWSLLDSNGDLLTDSRSEEIIYLGHSLIAVKTDCKQYSIINFYGKRATDTLFDSVLCFGMKNCTMSMYDCDYCKKDEGLNYAIVGIGDKYGLIDHRGRVIFHPRFTSLSIQENNQFLADGILINASGQKIVAKGDFVLIVNGNYDSIRLLDNGLLLISKDNLYGCMNQRESLIIPLKYSFLGYDDNLFMARYDDEEDGHTEWGVIDLEENEIVPFSEGITDVEITSNIILYEQNGHWGAYTRQGRLICDPIYDHIVYMNDHLIKVGENGEDYERFADSYSDDGQECTFTNFRDISIIHWGLIDFYGKELLPLEYREIEETPVNGIVKIRNEIQFGYVDIVGHIVLPPAYKSIGDFVNGYAVVSKVADYGREWIKGGSTLYGVIDSSFREIIPCIFNRIEYDVEDEVFRTDAGCKTLDGRYIVDNDGDEIYIDKKYKYCTPFNEGCAIAVLVSDNGVRFGLIDTESKDIIPPIFSRLNYISEDGLYKFKLNGLYGIINSRGEIVVKNIYESIGKFEDDIACVQTSEASVGNRLDTNYRYGFIDYQGEIVLEPIYEFIGRRKNKMVVVMKYGVWGLFDTISHEVKIIPGAAYLGPCIENICRFNQGGSYDKNTKRITGGLWGYVSKDGHIIVEPTYEKAGAFSDGMAVVKLHGKWGFVDTKGSIVVPCEYDDVESKFIQGSGALIKNGEVFAFDKKGKQISPALLTEEDVDSSLQCDYDPAINDNPYYDENLDMNEQSQEFWCFHLYARPYL